MSKVEDIKKEIKATHYHMSKNHENNISSERKLSSLRQKLADINNKPTNIQRRKKAFQKWTYRNGYLLFGMPHTTYQQGNRSEDDTGGYGGYDLKNTGTVFTLWTKFNLKPLRVNSSHQPTAFINFSSEKPFLKAYAKRIIFNSDAFKIANTIINPNFKYGYVEFFINNLSGEDVKLLTDSENDMKHINPKFRHYHYSKDISRNVIWSKDSIKDFAYVVGGFNPIFNKMVKSGAMKYRHYTGLFHNEINDLPNISPMNYDPTDGYRKHIVIKGHID